MNVIAIHAMITLNALKHTLHQANPKKSIKMLATICRFQTTYSTAQLEKVILEKLESQKSERISNWLSSRKLRDFNTTTWLTQTKKFLPKMFFQPKKKKNSCTLTKKLIKKTQSLGPHKKSPNFSNGKPTFYNCWEY